MMMLSLFLLALIPLVATSHGVRDNDHHRHPQTSCPSNNPFTLEPAFTITLQLGQFPPQIQPPNSNGTFGLQPVLSGTVAGPLLNGTIIRGLGHASRFTTYYLDDDESYGTTDDGFSFYFHQSGVGNGIGKVDRLEVTIGGPYAYLSESFLLQAAETNVTAAGGTLVAQVYLAGSTLQSFP